MPARFGDLASGEYDLPPSWSLFELGIYLHRRDRHRYRLHSWSRAASTGRPTSRSCSRRSSASSCARRRATRAVARDLLAPDPGRCPAWRARAPRRVCLERLAVHAEARPTAPALSDADGELDYRTLDRPRGPRRPRCSTRSVPTRSSRCPPAAIGASSCGCSRAGAPVSPPSSSTRHGPTVDVARAAEIAGVTHAYPDGDLPITATGRPVPEVDPGAGARAVHLRHDRRPARRAGVLGRAADAAVADLVELLHVSADDRVSMLSGAAHDPVLRDVGLALHAGATLCLPPTDVSQTRDSLRPGCVGSG